jgi:hypothetical protein
MKNLSILMIMLLPFGGLFAQDPEGWFPFQPTNTAEAGIIGMADWLDAPAGKHGILKIDGDDFRFEDGTKIKFWGTNHGNRTCGPEKAEAEKRAEWYAKMGINGVRLHKFTYSGNGGFGQLDNSSRLTDEGWDRLDYYMYQLRQKGIYYSWSPIYGHRLVDGDSARVVAYGEIKRGPKGNTTGLVNFAEDLQDVVIDLMTHLLEHRNAYTGLRYADDPALISVEMQNEDNIFWAFARTLDICPTYKKMLCKQYCDWLRKKYGNHENVMKAWGPNAKDMFPKNMTDEHLDKNNIYPATDFRNFSEEMIKKSPSPQRMLDNARFCHEVQEDFYNRYQQAIRATGYKGPIVGSCWQAGSGVSHYYNLYSDYKAGIIDRHNYFGARPHSLTNGAFPNKSMFNYPGSGLISSGLMSVKDRPFVFSEWTVKMPTEWIADGPAIIGVYGMGLQDWDGSFHFASRTYGFSNAMEDPNVYNSNNFTQAGLFPAIARMIYRNDVREGKMLPNRKVHVPSLAEGKIGFTETIKQEIDVKELGGDVPIDALMKGKLQLEFTDKAEKSELDGYKKILDEKKIVSNTGQLEWFREGDGCFTVNTPGTVAVCGFAGQKSFKLGDFEIKSESPYCMIFITATERGKTLKESKSILISTIARARNSGMKMEINSKEGTLVEKGTAPLLVEPVKATISTKISKKFSVRILDHDGLPTEKSVEVNKNNFHLDGAQNKTIWYEMQIN